MNSAPASSYRSPSLTAAVYAVVLAACGGGNEVDQTASPDATVTQDEGGKEAGVTCGDTPVKLVDYVGDVPDAGRSAVQVPTIGVTGNDLFYVLNWFTPLGAPAGPGGFLMRVPITGGEPVRMAVIAGGGGQSGQGLAVTRTAAIFNEAREGGGGEGAIVSVPTAGGEPMTLALTAGLANALVADDRNVYFVDSEGTKSVPLTGGAVQTLTSLRPYSLMVDGSTLYLAEFEQPGGVSSLPTSGGSVTVLATVADGAIHPVRCGENVCWMTGPALFSRLEQLDPEGHVTVLAATELTQPHDLVFDGENFFVTTGGGGFLLQRIPAAGGEPIVIHVNGGLSSLALDDACLYWSSASGIYAWARAAAGAAAAVGP